MWLGDLFSLILRVFASPSEVLRLTCQSKALTLFFTLIIILRILMKPPIIIYVYIYISIQLCVFTHLVIYCLIYLDKFVRLGLIIFITGK